MLLRIRNVRIAYFIVCMVANLVIRFFSSDRKSEKEFMIHRSVNYAVPDALFLLWGSNPGFRLSESKVINFVLLIEVGVQ